MALPIFPFSPLPANLERFKNWNENDITYDSGEHQTDTAFVKPLYQWTIPVKLMTEIKQSSVWAFWDDRKGGTRPFLMKDPYDYAVASVMAVRSGITNAATLYFRDLNSYSIRPDTVAVGSLFSTLSGYVRNGVEYSIEQDTGIVTVNTKATADVWGARSLAYFKKVKFGGPYKETSQMWNIFATNWTIVELP